MCTIALEHEETRSRAYEHAFTDPLTHLPNRARFQQRVSETMAIVAETGQRVAVQYIGLDRFQASTSCSATRQAMSCCASSPRACKALVKDQDAVARIGGDEFAVIQVGDFSDEDSAARARQIIELIGEPFLACGQRLELGASVGIAIGPDDGNTADELIQDAALAMRRVKEIGRGTYIFYEKELNARMQARRRAESDLREALAKEQFELYFQPIFDLQSFEISGRRGAAALAASRARHDLTGRVHPARRAVRPHRSAWRVGASATPAFAAAKWPHDVGIAVNLSPVQFDNPGLVRTVADALAQLRLSNRRGSSSRSPSPSCCTTARPISRCSMS